MRIIKHPVEKLMKMDCTWSMNEVVQMQAAQNVAPDFREAFISYCDLTTLAQRLKENPNLTLEFRDPKEKVYLMTTLPQNYDLSAAIEKDGGGRRARQHRQNGLPAPHEPRYPHAD